MAASDTRQAHIDLLLFFEQGQRMGNVKSFGGQYDVEWLHTQAESMVGLGFIARVRGRGNGTIYQTSPLGREYLAALRTS